VRDAQSTVKLPPEPPPAAFLTRLALYRHGRLDSGLWVVAEDFIFYSAKLGRLIKVPAGFVTDLASVPRLPLMYWLCGATADEAAVIHDFLYRDMTTTRKEADDVFAEAMEVIARIKQGALAADGVPGWRRWFADVADDARRLAMWAGVRAGGRSSFKERAGTITATNPPNPVEVSTADGPG
jgi:hypothetical protein